MAKKINLPHIVSTNASKGYVFKCNARIPYDVKQKLVKDLTTQLHNGILIYEGEFLELVDIYNLATAETCDSKPIEKL